MASKLCQKITDDGDGEGDNDDDRVKNQQRSNVVKCVLVRSTTHIRKMMTFMEVTPTSHHKGTLTK